MNFKVIAVLASFAPVALANFMVYCGNACANDGAGCPISCTFFNSYPNNCDEINNSVNHLQSQDNDASGPCSGLACDGCSMATNPRDWQISRLEINNGQGCTPSKLYWSNAGDNPHFTIVDDFEDISVQLLDTNNNSLGFCYRAPIDQEGYECFAGISSTFYVLGFECITDIEYLDSQN